LAPACGETSFNAGVLETAPDELLELELEELLELELEELLELELEELLELDELDELLGITPPVELLELEDELELEEELELDEELELELELELDELVAQARGDASPMTSSESILGNPKDVVERSSML